MSKKVTQTNLKELIKNILEGIESATDKRNIKNGMDFELEISPAKKHYQNVRVKFGIIQNEGTPKKLKWLDLREVPREVYKFLFSNSGGFFFWFFVIVFPFILLPLLTKFISNNIQGIEFRDFLEFLPLVQIELREVFSIISSSLLIGGLVFLGTVVIEARHEFKKSGNLKDIWNEMLKVITFTFAVAILNLVLISFLDLVVQKNLEIQTLFSVFSLTVYTFYLILDRIEKTFF